MKCEGTSSSSSHDVADILKPTPEMMLLDAMKYKKTMFLHGMDAFDDFLQLVAPQSSNSIAMQMEEGFVVDDDDNSFFSDDSEDESSKNVRSRVLRERGVRRDHSGVLERLLQARHTIEDEIGCAPPRHDKKLVIRDTINGSKHNKSMNKEKPTIYQSDLPTNAASVQRRRPSSSTSLHELVQVAPESSKHDKKAARMLSRHSAHELSKSDQSTTGRRRGRRLTPPTPSTMEQQAEDVRMMADPICSVLQEMSRIECRGSSIRRSRGGGDVASSSEHCSSRPRLRRDTLYAATRQVNSSSGTSDTDRSRIPRPNSEIDFQKAAATAAKKHERQSAGTRRISGGAAAASPTRDGMSRESLRYSTANCNGSAELVSELSPPRLSRSNTTGTNLCRSKGPKRSLNNLKLDGVYSSAPRSSLISPKRTVEDVRRSLKKNGGRNDDIDDLVVKMTTKGRGLPTTNRGNATWN